MEISDLIDGKIVESIKAYDNSYELGDNPFEELLSMGELVTDYQLSISNFIN